MGSIETKALHHYVYLYERESDPAGGRAEHHQIAQLTVDAAERLIKGIEAALPVARAAERKRATDALASAKVALKEAEQRVESLQDRVVELTKQSGRRA